MSISALCIGLGFGEVVGKNHSKAAIISSSSSSENDFDFLIGKWKIKNRKLKTRLNNCVDWIEFEATGEMQKILNGLGNTDNFLATLEGNSFEGRTLRLFDPKTKLWSIYWADSNTGVLDKPVSGFFDGSIGKFYTKDTFNGKEIVVVFQWDKTNPDEPVWSQAFSPDAGKTWEWNWYMEFFRSDDVNANQILKVIELRNYLLKPNTLDRFQHYFQDHFFESQEILQGHLLGQFKIKDVDNRFFWLRGFGDMASRLNFLKSFYDKSPAWKKYGPGANDMMLDSSQVHLLRPLNPDGDWQADSRGIIRNDFFSKVKVTVIDYYFAKPGRLEELVNFFRNTYAPQLKVFEKINFSVWITEQTKSEFRHPVIQDNNLLVAITSFQNEDVYRKHSGITTTNQKISEALSSKETLVLYDIST